MAEADNELASILADVERVLGKGTKRGPAHRSTSMHLASGVLCFQTHQNPAVQRCCNLRNGILCESLTPEERQQFDPGFLCLYDHFKEEIDEETENYKIANTAALAYRTAMPDPITAESALLSPAARMSTGFFLKKNPTHDRWPGTLMRILL